MKRKADDEGRQGSVKRSFIDSGEFDHDDDETWVEPTDLAPGNGDSESVFSEPTRSDDGSSTALPAPTAVTTTTVNSRAQRSTRSFPSDLKTIHCPWPSCESTFNRPARLATHMRSHTNDRIYKCTFDGCDKSYTDKKHLSQHIKGSHTHEKKYICTVEGCNKSFLTGTRLRRHAAVHEGQDRYRCRDYEGCNQTFRKRTTLQRHIRADHLGLPKYLCVTDDCGEGFDSAPSLRRHMEREHGEIRFWCDECEEKGDNDEGTQRVGFTTITLLQSHLRREHVNCMFCEARCRGQGELERHIDLYHSGKTVQDRKTHKCDVCEATFTRASNLKTHVKTAHEGFRYVCGQVDTFAVGDIADWNWMEEGCGQSFASKVRLEDHVRYVHLGRKRPPNLYATFPELAEQQRDVFDDMVGMSDAAKRKILCSSPGCGARFIRHHDLDVHVRTVHVQEQEQEQEQEGDVQVGEIMTSPSSVFPVDPQLQLDASNSDAEWADVRKLIDVDALMEVNV